MVVEYFVAQSGYVNVGIYLRRRYVFVSEHLLDGSQIGSALQQRCGERVSERVGRHGLRDAGVARRVLYHYQYHGAREVCSSAVEEHVFVFAGFDVHEVAVVEPQLQFVQGVGRYGHEALLVALARDAQVAVCGENVAELKVYEFGDAQSAGEKHFDNGTIALSLGFGEVDRLLHAVYLFCRKHLWKVFAERWRLKKLRRVVFERAVE